MTNDLVLRYSFLEDGIRPNLLINNSNGQFLPYALATIVVTTNYNFDGNVATRVYVTDDVSRVDSHDPMNRYIINIEYIDKVDNAVIKRIQGRLNPYEGGLEKLAETHANDDSYVMGKLDFYGALDSDDDFIVKIESYYNPKQSSQLLQALKKLNIINSTSSFRVNSTQLSLLSVDRESITAEQAKRMILDMPTRPRYLAIAGVDELDVVEALAEVAVRFNSHLLIDVGKMTDWKKAVAVINSINFTDERIACFWSPNKSRPRGATSLLARKKWRPVVGDYLGQILLRNTNTNESGIAPVHVAIAGYDFPVGHKDLEKLRGVVLDEEAQNALAEAKLNVVLSENFSAGERWIYGDVLTQYDSKTSALRLIPSAEVTTYIQNNAVAIAKRHLLKPTSSYIEDASIEIEQMLNACVGAGLIVFANQLNSYYSFNLVPSINKPFEKVNLTMAFRPDGCVRQVEIDTEVTR